MEGILVAEKDHSVVITVDTEIIGRNRIQRALDVLEAEEPDYSHIPDADPEEQKEIVRGLRSMTPEEKEFSLVRRRNDL